MAKCKSTMTFLTEFNLSNIMCSHPMMMTMEILKAYSASAKMKALINE